MAASQTQFFFFTFLLIVVSFQAQARESRFFSKTTPYEQPRQREDLPQQQEEVQTEFTPLSAFKETPSEENQNNGHGLYSHEPTQFPPTTTTTIPETQLTPIDYTSFKTPTNEYNNFDSKDRTSGFSGYGLSDTRVLEKGKYFYDIQKEGYQNGFPYQRGTSGSGFEYPTENGYGSENRYAGSENRYGGYHGNQKGYGGYSGNKNRYGGYENENGYYETNNYDNKYKNEEFIP